MLAAALPDLHSLDLEAIKALLISQHDLYTQTLHSRATEIERLTMLVAKLQHMLFGRKSEKVLRQIEQLELQIEDLVAAGAVEEAQADALEKDLHRSSHFAAHCLSIFPVSSTCICQATRHAPTVADGCASWAKMLPRCWNMFEPVSRSYAMCDRS